MFAVAGNSLEALGRDRRFSGLERLYGRAGAARIRGAHVAVVGIGGVGSWAAEALARSGVGRLTFVDLDHVAESNINRQIHATTRTVGQAKVQAMRERIAEIHPDCDVRAMEEFAEPSNWAELARQASAPHRLSGLLDACDQVRAKATLAAWARAEGLPFVTVGAAGGKRQAHRVELGDLSKVTHDPLLAQLRYQLRKHHGFPKDGKAMHVDAVFSREPVAPPDPSCNVQGDGSLNCHGYGSVVTVTATFGLVAAGRLLERLAAP